MMEAEMHAMPIESVGERGLASSYGTYRPIVLSLQDAWRECCSNSEASPADVVRGKWSPSTAHFHLTHSCSN